MERITVSLDDELLHHFDGFIRRKGYTNRSEAVRDILRDLLQEDRLSTDEAPHCVASMSYVYNHHERELSRRLANIQHAHHDLFRATVHVHLDHENCLEVSLLEGPTRVVRDVADAIAAETGVRHSQVKLIPVEVTVMAGIHGAGGLRHGHHDHPVTDRPHVHTKPSS